MKVFQPCPSFFGWDPAVVGISDDDQLILKDVFGCNFLRS
jgi:hypothetical protein